MADQHPQSRINSRLTVILAVLVILSALPLASNRAVWWQFWTLSISVTALIYFWRKDRLLRSFKPRFMHYHLAFLLALVVPAYALLQAAPIAGILPDGLWALRAGMEEMQGRAISVYPGVSATGAIRFMGYVILFALILEVTTRAQRVSLLAVLLFIGIVAQGVWALAALNMLGDYAPWGKEAYLGYATGTFVNRNSLAFYLGMGMILGVGILAHWSEQPQIRSPGKLTWFQRLGADGVFIFVGLAMLAVALIETGSRAGLASSCAGVLTTLTMIRLRAGTTWRRIVLEIAGLFLALLIGLALFTQGEGVAERLLFTGKEGASRMEIYRQVIDMISVRPLTGFGFDTFGPAFEAFRAPPLILDKYYDLAHNSYLGLWAELGLIVGSVPVLLLATTSLGAL